MRNFVGLLPCLFLSLAACVINGNGDDDPGPPLPGNDDCLTDQCVCPVTESCEHTCDDGTPQCHIQAAPGRAVDVVCDSNLECHVECMSASSCEVECGGSAECHVTCPATGCTVTGCSGAGCVVSCGIGAAATRIGSTATCP